MEPETSPGHGGEDGGAGGPETGMIVADDELKAGQAALLQALADGSPMHFRFGARRDSSGETYFRARHTNWP